MKDNELVDDFEDVTDIPEPGDLRNGVIEESLGEDQIAQLVAAEGEAEAQVAELDHSEVGLRMVAQALTQRGVQESGGQNRGIPYTRYTKRFWPNSDPQPWCAFFVSWCFLEVTGKTPPWSNPGLVRSLYNWASAKGRLVQTPLRGDLFFYRDLNHIGLVQHSLQSTFVSIEGNYSDRVAENSRNRGDYWYARL